MREIVVSTPAVTASGLALRHAASTLSSIHLSGDPAACGNDLAAAAVSGLLRDVRELTDAAALDLARAGALLNAAAAAYAGVEGAVAGST